MKCHYIYDKEFGKIHIPGCMGAAHMGPIGCHCRYMEEKYPNPENEKNKLIKELEKENARLNRIIKNLIKQ